MTAILGISAFYHDSAAALVVDGKIIAAAQEERFTRKKYDESFPVHSIRYCLEESGLKPEQIDYIGFYDKPFLKFSRLLETYLSYAPQGFRSFARAMPIWLNTKLHLSREMNEALGGAYKKRFIFTHHHESHAASAFYPSPFEEAAILTLDGVGEWSTASLGVGRGNQIELLQHQQFPHSLGLLYSAFTYYCGFAVNSGEYKLMGLAPYGTPKYADLIRKELIDLKGDGSFRMDMSYFNYCQGLTMTSEKFHRLLGGPPRKPDSLLQERDMDIAASIQRVTEEIILRIARHAHTRTGMSKLCLAGGVALNCVANGRLLREGPFNEIWIQPAAGDAGGALGVALFIWHQLLGKPRIPDPCDSQAGSLLGPAFSDSQIYEFLAGVNAVYERIDDEEELTHRVAAEIASGAVVGWFQGRMEFGPRALGSRSIIGDPRNPAMQTTMNVKVKFREGFRPFAPAVLRESAPDYFNLDASVDSPYMLIVAPVLDRRRVPLPPEQTIATGIGKLKAIRSEIPAVTHVDYSARVQTVDTPRHGIYRKLLESFYRQTGCPVIVNTSFNLGWDPIVCTPQEAFTTFMASDMDVLCLGGFLLTKKAQPAFVTLKRSSAVSFRCLCGCGGSLMDKGTTLVSTGCGHVFTLSEDIPQLFWPDDSSKTPGSSTESVKVFPDSTPFPDYCGCDSLRSLIEESRREAYVRALDTAIPYNSSVLDVGCGTGHLANFLGISCRLVTGVDLSLNSLRLADEFRKQHNLERVRFVQANLFRLPFEPGQFDVVVCNDVLHHTSDPLRGLLELVPLVRPGGHIIISLNNAYSGLKTNLRRLAFRPHESRHRIGEVLEWFKSAGLEFVRGAPSVTGNAEDLARADLFRPTAPGSAWNHFWVQLKQAFAGSRGGGLFIMIARRPESVDQFGTVEELMAHGGAPAEKRGHR
jgi:carbamoyltransferase